MSAARSTAPLPFSRATIPPTPASRGSWLSDAPYGVIHRVASDGRMPGVFHRCAAFCRARCANLRIDTHHDNHTMQRLIEGAGFRRCGVIYVEDGSPRIAYQTPCP